MTRTLPLALTALSVLCWALVVVMALLQVVHLAHGQSTEHWAATFAAQLAVIAAVFSTGAWVASQSDKRVQQGD